MNTKARQVVMVVWSIIAILVAILGTTLFIAFVSALR
jgi:hypothetical protein